MLRFPTRKQRFYLSAAWFASVQAVQLSWFTSTDYMGLGIIVVYLFLAIAIGLQFGLLSFFFDAKTIALRNCFALAGSWVILEWARTFFLTGFTWNPVGLSLADSPYAIQFASLFGVYGLSFWVMFVNAFVVYAGFQSWKWLGLAALPYAFGVCQQAWVETHSSFDKPISVALVQTAILPEEKDQGMSGEKSFIPPLQQWERIWTHLEREKNPDLIVFPEAVVSFGARLLIHSREAVKEAWERHFGEDAALPPVYTRKVTNAFIVQAIANHFQADVIAGFDDQEEGLQYNAAFHFRPQEAQPMRYEKKILVPMGEYIPLTEISWIRNFLSEQFGIYGSFSEGRDMQLFSFSGVPVGVSICLEETYSELMRDVRRKGAEFFVNVSNDSWFPRSRLPWQHLQHGRLRSAENGAPTLRACNTGITGGIDCFGGVIETIAPSEKEVGVLYFSFPVRSFHTLYTWWGDLAILLCSALCLLFCRWKNVLQIVRAAFTRL